MGKEEMTMPRHRKNRRICSLPKTEGFQPISENKTLYEEVILNIDEHEVIRLIDLEKLTQEQCAVQMAVSRTTITNIYEGARFKIADALINTKKLVVDGGEFILCEHKEECCGKGCKYKCFNEEKKHCEKKCCQKLSTRIGECEFGS